MIRCALWDLARLGDPPGAVNVQLDNVHRPALDQLAEAVAGELVLAAGDERVDLSRNLSIAGHIVGHHRFFDPGQVEAGLLQHFDHADGIAHVPTHVGISGQNHVRTHHVAHRPHQLQIAPHARQALTRSIGEALLHGREALVNIALRFGGQLVEILGRI